MSLKLVKPSMEWKEQHLDFVKEWDDNKEDITPYAVRLLDMEYDMWLKNTLDFENKDTCPSEWVPATTYFLTRDDKIIGAVNIRHELNNFLLNYGGHIGYGIRPSERKKGYATKLLAMSLDIVRELGLNKVLIICDKENIGSARTIQKNGGILENETLNDSKIIQRYWIKL